MGIDLTLAPMKYGNSDWWLCSNRLTLDRDYDLQERIKALPSYPTYPAKNIQWYEDDGVKDRATDAYGDPLRFVRAVQFRRVLDDQCRSEWNLAALKFIQALPPLTPIVLWWH